LIKLNNERFLFNFYVKHGFYDKPARAAIFNIKSCTAFYGCFKCMQKGEGVTTKKGYLKVSCLGGTIQTYPYGIFFSEYLNLSSFSGHYLNIRLNFKNLFLRYIYGKRL
jgi:hypothetical protein